MKNVRRILLIALLAWVVFTVPAAAQEATPEATSLPLTQTFSNKPGTVTFSYPEGWIVQPGSPEGTSLPNWATLSTTSSVQNKILVRGDIFLPGEAQIIVGVTNICEGTAPNMSGLCLRISEPSNMIRLVMDQHGTAQPTFGTPSDLTVGIYPAAEVMATASSGEETFLEVNYGQGRIA